MRPPTATQLEPGGRSLTPEMAARIAHVFVEQRKRSLTVRRRNARERIERLDRLRKALLDHREAFKAALAQDFGKPPPESDLTEILPTIVELRHVVAHLRKWTKPRRVPTPWIYAGTSSRIHHDPKGVALIIAPWNYSLLLTLSPLIGAVAAGNCVMMKPSEFTPHTSDLIRRMLATVFDENEVAVFEGDHTVAQELLTHPFDHIFFTGSPEVGKKVMEAAATHLCSVTLELGGKSPAIVDETADIEAAAYKLAIGAFINAGQTCIAPDYVLVEASRQEALVAALCRVIGRLYGETARERRASPDYARIIDDRHHNRLSGLLNEAIAQGARVAFGGQVEAGATYIEPTVLTDVPLQSRIMREEIFGPLLPIIPYRSLDEVVDVIRERPNPLTLYVFSRNRATIRRLLQETMTGSTLVNDTLIHFGNVELPFGGAGFSGIGRTHGHSGFLAFTNERSVMRQRWRTPPFRFIYPPYDRISRRLHDVAIRFFGR